MKADVILQDPPWFYCSRRAGGETKNKTKFNGGAEKHYICPAWRVERRLKQGWSEKKAHEANLTNKELLEVGKLIDMATADDSVNFLWRTCPTVEFACQFMRSCGDIPRTDVFNWLKTTNDGKKFRYGPGWYSGSNLEPVLIGTKGKALGQPACGLMPSVVVDYDPDEENPAEIFDTQFVKSVTICPRGKHSEKPDIHAAIEKLYPGKVYLELFARRERPGWTCLGGDLSGNDILQDLMIYINSGSESAE
jgi:N6-adenosine-specific RNA methylase IME4